MIDERLYLSPHSAADYLINKLIADQHSVNMLGRKTFYFFRNAEIVSFGDILVASKWSHDRGWTVSFQISFGSFIASAFNLRRELWAMCAIYVYRKF